MRYGCLSYVVSNGWHLRILAPFASGHEYDRGDRHLYALLPAEVFAIETRNFAPTTLEGSERDRQSLTG
jgi:hypothetical protein